MPKRIKERRKDRRLPLGLSIEYELSEGQPTDLKGLGVAKNVCTGGLLFETTATASLLPGAQLDLRIGLPSGLLSGRRNSSEVCTTQRHSSRFALRSPARIVRVEEVFEEGGKYAPESMLLVAVEFRSRPRISLSAEKIHSWCPWLTSGSLKPETEPVPA